MSENSKLTRGYASFSVRIRHNQCSQTAGCKKENEKCPVSGMTKRVFFEQKDF
jgi:hypothetical protein